MVRKGGLPPLGSISCPWTASSQLRYSLRPHGPDRLLRHSSLMTEGRTIFAALAVQRFAQSPNRSSRSLTMDSPNPTAPLNSRYRYRYFLPFLFLLTSLSFFACTRVTKGTEPKP